MPAAGQCGTAGPGPRSGTGGGGEAGTGGPGGHNAGSRGRKERHDLMAVTNEQQAHITPRGKEKGRAGGGRGSVSFRQSRGRPPQRRPRAAAAPGTARAHRRLLEGNSQPQGSRSPRGTPSSSGTEIPVRPCGLPTGRGHPWGRAAAPGRDRSLRGLRAPNRFSKCRCFWCLCCPCSGR